MKSAAVALARGSRLGAAEKASGLVGRVLRRRDRRTAPGGRALLGRLPGLGAWTDACDLPLPPKESFRAWWKRTGAGQP